MGLTHVNVGDQHAAAHNEERDKINSLDTSTTTLQGQSSSVIQRTRQDVDNRWRPQPLNTELTRTVSATADSSLTKSYAFSIAGQTGGTGRIATAAELAAYPVDFGQDASPIDVYAVGSYGYAWNLGTNDKTTTPPPNNTFRLMPTAARFMTDATLLSIAMYRINGAVQDGDQIFIDGVPTSARANAGGGITEYLVLSFADSRTREITLRTTAGIGPIFVGPNYDVWKPEPRYGPIFYISGDSYSDPMVFIDNGVSAGSFIESLGFGIGDGCGAAEYYIDAIGGTGFNMSNSGQESNSGAVSNNYEARLPQLVAAAQKAWANNQQDFVWCIPNGAVNDVANYGVVNRGVTISQQTVVDAVRRMALALRAVHPNARIIWGHGFCPPSSILYGKDALHTALRQALQTQLADIGVYYIDTTGWIQGTGWLGGSGTFVGSTTNGQPTITGSGYDATAVGASVSGPGIPAGAYILSFQSPTQLTLNVNATATAAKVTLTASTTRRNGNSSVFVGADYTHLTGLGYRYLKGRYLPKLRRIMTDAGALLNTAI